MHDLTNLNTLRIPAKAEKLVEINSLSDLNQLDTKEPILFLGHGANVLFVTEVFSQVAKVNLKGKKVISEDDDSVLLEVAAGENWHELVKWSVENGWSGIENLALIPGTIGAAITGNIAAYSQQTSDVVVSVSILDLITKKAFSLSKEECKFAYRSSAFQSDFSSSYLITSATLKLSKIPHIKTEFYDRYLSLSDEIRLLFPDKDPSTYTSLDVFQGVVSIRTKKMPDWNQIGTAGSFFKNPFVTKEKLQELQSRISELQYYPITDMDYPKLDDPNLTRADFVKVPAGRLLDELGWRSKRIGNVGTYDKHALVIVNFGGTGKEVHEFTESMREDIKKNFAIDLDYEVKLL